MDNMYVEINWNDLNMNKTNDKNMLNEIEKILEKYGYNGSIVNEYGNISITRYYNDKFIVN